MEQLCRIEIRGIVGSTRLYEYDGKPYAKISVATSVAYKDREGNAVIDTMWHNVTAWEGKNIHDLEKIQKGDKIHIIGRPRIQRFTGDDGIERMSSEVLAAKVELIEGDEQLGIGI